MKEHDRTVSMRNFLRMIVGIAGGLLLYLFVVQAASAQNSPLSRFAFLQIQIPPFRNAYYQATGRYPGVGYTARVDIMKQEAPFDVNSIAFPDGMPIGAFIIKDPDGIDRAYSVFTDFPNQWVLFGQYNEEDIARVALWPGRYVITFDVVNPEGGSLGGFLPTYRVNLTPGLHIIGSN